MDASVRGALAALVKRNKVVESPAKLYVSPSVMEAAILEKLFEDDEWTDAIQSIGGSEVLVDPDLPQGSAYVVDAKAARKFTGRRISRRARSLADEIAWRRFGPRRSGF